MKWPQFCALILLGCLAAAASFTPKHSYFFETFEGSTARWIPSAATKTTNKGIVDKYDGEWAFELPTKYPASGTKGLVVKSASKHHAISTLLNKPIVFDGTKDFVIQYEVKLTTTLNCGGAYMKLLTHESDFTPETFDDKTPYTIMFGPDKCGESSKVHFIFRYKDPKGNIEEKHITNPPSIKNDVFSNVYTVVVKPDNTFRILINNEEARSGSLLYDTNPLVNPPEEINDPEDKKPEDWVEEALIPDVKVTKPDDWDEDTPLMIEDVDAVMPDDWLVDEDYEIPDPEAKKPEDWNEEDDGDWEAPLVENMKCRQVSGCGPWRRPMKRNPAYKGPWEPPLISNPAYKGPWVQKKIPNPDYFYDPNPNKFSPIGAIGFELWTLQNGIIFDNIYIGSDEKEAYELAETLWKGKYQMEQDEKYRETSKKKNIWMEAAYEILSKCEHFFEEMAKNPVRAVSKNPGIAFALLGMPAVVFIIVTIALTSTSKGGIPKATAPRPPPRNPAAAPISETKEENAPEPKEEPEAEGSEK